jgi:hypothetical protein
MKNRQEAFKLHRTPPTNPVKKQDEKGDNQLKVVNDSEKGASRDEQFFSTTSAEFSNDEKWNRANQDQEKEIKMISLEVESLLKEKLTLAKELDDAVSNFRDSYSPTNNCLEETEESLLTKNFTPSLIQFQNPVGERRWFSEENQVELSEELISSNWTLKRAENGQFLHYNSFLDETVVETNESSILSSRPSLNNTRMVLYVNPYGKNHKNHPKMGNNEFISDLPAVAMALVKAVDTFLKEKDSLVVSVAPNHLPSLQTVQNAMGKNVAGDLWNTLRFVEDSDLLVRVNGNEDTIVSGGSRKAIYYGLGCAELAGQDLVTKRSLRVAIIDSRPPGHHHCPGKQPSGFCYCNYTVTVIQNIRLQEAACGDSHEKLVNWDIDGHRGNGNAHDLLVCCR